jgi:hypothetical protein
LAAFLTGQHQAGGGPVRDQRRFAMLTMKEDVGISCDFAGKMFRRFHDKQTSSPYARLRVKLRRGRPNQRRSGALTKGT